MNRVDSEYVSILYRYLSEDKLVKLNVNIYGIPLYNSSKAQFWPILVNIHDMPFKKPIVVGIFCGLKKPGNIEQFLRPFVDELSDILTHGLLINGFKLTVLLRCFICDSPARALIKGNSNKVQNILKNV